MSVFNHDQFIKSITKRLEDILTVTQMAALVTAMAEELKGYEVTPLEQGEASREYLDVFIRAKKLEGKSPKTVERYNKLLVKVLMRINKSVELITIDDLREYLTYKKEETGCSDRTLEGERSVLSAFFGWLHKAGMLQQDPTATLGHIKYKKEMKIPFSATDVERLRECSGTLRNRAIIETLLATGCRAAELCSLKVSDVDFVNSEITVLGKGNKERTVYLNEVAIMILKRYLDSRSDTGEELFHSKMGCALTTSGLRTMLGQMEKTSGVENVHAHRFRRTLATNLINRGMSIQEVAAILGHENINTTLTYVYIGKANVKHSYQKCAS